MVTILSHPPVMKFGLRHCCVVNLREINGPSVVRGRLGAYKFAGDCAATRG